MQKITWTLHYILRLARILLWAIGACAVFTGLWAFREEMAGTSCPPMPVAQPSFLAILFSGFSGFSAGLVAFLGAWLLFFVHDTGGRHLADSSEYPDSEGKRAAGAYADFMVPRIPVIRRILALVFFLLPSLLPLLLIFRGNTHELPALLAAPGASLVAFFLFLKISEEKDTLPESGVLFSTGWYAVRIYRNTFGLMASWLAGRKPSVQSGTTAWLPLQFDPPVRNLSRLNPAIAGFWLLLGFFHLGILALAHEFRGGWSEDQTWNLVFTLILLGTILWMVISVQILNELFLFPLGLWLLAGTLLYYIQSLPDFHLPVRVREIVIRSPDSSPPSPADTLNVTIRPSDKWPREFRIWSEAFLAEWHRRYGAGKTVRVAVPAAYPDWNLISPGSGEGPADESGSFAFMAGEALRWKSALFFRGVSQHQITGRAARPTRFRLIQTGAKGTEDDTSRAGMQIFSRGKPLLFIPFYHSYSPDLSPSEMKAVLNEKARKDAAEAGRVSMPVVRPPVPTSPSLLSQNDDSSGKKTETADTSVSAIPENTGNKKGESKKKSGGETMISPATHPHLYYFSLKQKKWKRRDEADFDLSKIRRLRKKKISRRPKS